MVIEAAATRRTTERALLDVVGTADISVVLLTGTTGSGKTTVARAIAERVPVLDRR